MTNNYVTKKEQYRLIRLIESDPESYERAWDIITHSKLVAYLKDHKVVVSDNVVERLTREGLDYELLI